MNARLLALAIVVCLSVGTVCAVTIASHRNSSTAVAAEQVASPQDAVVDDNARESVDQGRRIFRFDTFGDEAFWGDSLKLHRAIEGADFGGVGAGVSPKTALAVGLKVDVDALPPGMVDQIKAGKVDLNSPATTLTLLRLNAVVGVKGLFAEVASAAGPGHLRSIGITCALCHSTVDKSTGIPGVGHRLDGWPNRDLNVGAIIDLAPDLTVVQNLLGAGRPALDKVFKSWGPGKFDAEVLIDGKAFRPDGKSAAVLIPAAFGLAGVNLHTYTGWGSVTYWNVFVANLEMHGKGVLVDSRLDNAAQFPVAAKNRLGHKHDTPDLITDKMAALQFYQLAIPAPTAPPGSFDPVAAERGKDLFDGMARCSVCHVPPLFTEPGWNMHTAQEIGIDGFQASRSPDRRYRTTPLRGLGAARMKGGFYHDGRFATLTDVVDHYNTTRGLHLSSTQVNDIVEYLKSL